MISGNWPSAVSQKTPWGRSPRLTQFLSLENQCYGVSPRLQYLIFVSRQVIYRAFPNQEWTGHVWYSIDMNILSWDHTGYFFMCHYWSSLGHSFLIYKIGLSFSNELWPSQKCFINSKLNLNLIPCPCQFLSYGCS